MSKYEREETIFGKNAGEIYEIVSQAIDRFLEKTVMGGYELRRDEESKSFFVDSKMFSAVLNCQDEKLSLEVKLGLLARPFKGKLDEGIDRWIAKTFPKK